MGWEVMRSLDALGFAKICRSMHGLFYLFLSLCLLAKHDETAIRVFKYTLIFIYPYLPLTPLSNFPDISIDLLPLFLWQHCDITFTRRPIHYNIIYSRKLVLPYFFQGWVERKFVGISIESLTPQPEPELRRSSFVSLDPSSYLRNPLRSLSRRWMSKY
jgi:hypothetical protein